MSSSKKKYNTVTMVFSYMDIEYVLKKLKQKTIHLCSSDLFCPWMLLISYMVLLNIFFFNFKCTGQKQDDIQCISTYKEHTTRHSLTCVRARQDKRAVRTQKAYRVQIGAVTQVLTDRTYLWGHEKYYHLLVVLSRLAAVSGKQGKCWIH